ncbi:MAG: Kynurenine formamidase [Chlamydiae bacterium]|nr:Kynurenine formamidase [Chlamydiota bacterium]
MDMTKIYDISLTLTEHTPVWPGSERAHFEQILSRGKGDDANVTQMNMCAHIGTHVDAPCHFLDVKDGVETLPLDILTGPAQVIELPKAKTISAEALQSAKISPDTKRLLIKTPNSLEWTKGATEFTTEYMGLSADAAVFLVEKGIQLIGVDYLSVAAFDEMVPTHQILLKAGIVIVEALDLSQITPEDYTLYCLPLKIAGADGAPARAILVK